MGVTVGDGAGVAEFDGLALGVAEAAALGLAAALGELDGEPEGEVLELASALELVPVTGLPVAEGDLLAASVGLAEGVDVEVGVGLGVGDGDGLGCCAAAAAGVVTSVVSIGCQLPDESR
jgi:hypothetical protein